MEKVDARYAMHGKKVTLKSKGGEIHVNPKMTDGQKITVHGQGDQMPGADSGNVIVVIKLTPKSKSRAAR